MSLELINTFGTLLTVAIIAATAIAAMVQLRHLRAGNQINAMLSIGNQFDAREYRDALRLIQHELDAALEDPLWREYICARARRTPLPTVSEQYRALVDAVILCGNTFEELGIFVKTGVVEREMFLDRYAWVIIQGWRRLERVIAWIRGVTDEPRLYENFEFLMVLADDFWRERGSTYPKGVRHIQLINPWPVPPVSANA